MEVPTQASDKPKELPANDDDLLSEGVEEIIVEHGGDARAAIRALLEQISYREMARNRALDLVSFGDARGAVE